MNFLSKYFITLNMDIYSKKYVQKILTKKRERSFFLIIFYKKKYYYKI